MNTQNKKPADSLAVLCVTFILVTKNIMTKYFTKH